MERIRILIVEDSVTDAELLVKELRTAGFAPDVTCVETETEYRAALTAHPDIIFADCAMPKFSCERALAVIRDYQLDVPLIVFSGTAEEADVTEYYKNGATDFIHKRHLTRTGPITRRALNEARQRNECRQLKTEFSRIQKASANGDLSTGLASEFATLLAAIQGSADILLSRNTIEGDLRKSIEQISSAAGRASKLAARLLPAA